jgi:hypothetical protein
MKIPQFLFRILEFLIVVCDGNMYCRNSCMAKSVEAILPRSTSLDSLLLKKYVVAVFIFTNAFRNLHGRLGVLLWEEMKSCTLSCSAIEINCVAQQNMDKQHVKLQGIDYRDKCLLTNSRVYTCK